LTTSKSLFS